jgi:hypothetical protein
VENPPSFAYLALRLWQSVLRLAVRRNSIYDGVFRRQSVPVFEKHRLPSTASRCADTIDKLSWNNVFSLVYFAWRLWQTVLRLAVRKK